MRKLRFSFVRAALLSASLILSLSFFAGCAQDDDDGINLPAGVSLLSDSDPIANTFKGNFGDAKFASDFAWATSCSCTKVDPNSIVGFDESAYHKMNALDMSSENWEEWDYADFYYKKDSEPVYVVYNTFTDADLTDGIQKEEIDKHSGVVIFRAKHSEYGFPVQNCYYGVKFQFLVGEEKEAPASRPSTIQYSDNLFIEGGYNPAKAYNTVDSIFGAVIMFDFNNTDYYSIDSWNYLSSGASIKSDVE